MKELQGIYYHRPMNRLVYIMFEPVNHELRCECITYKGIEGYSNSGVVSKFCLDRDFDLLYLCHLNNGTIVPPLYPELFI